MSSNKITIALAGLVAALSVPSTAHAQSVTPERALLNQVPGARFQAPAAERQDGIDGERALLNHHQSVVLEPVESAVADVASVDGVKALLNRASS